MELESKDTDRAEKYTRLMFTTHDEDVEQLSNKHFSFQIVEVYLSCS